MFSESRFRSFCIRKNNDEFSMEELRKIAYDYLNKCVRGVSYLKWPTDIKEQMNSIGVYQESGTGKPIFDQALSDTWKDRCAVSEQEAVFFKNQFNTLIDLVKKYHPDTYHSLPIFESDNAPVIMIEDSVNG